MQDLHKIDLCQKMFILSHQAINGNLKLRKKHNYMDMNSISIIALVK